jgi:predicted dehydrogenase
LAGKLTLAIVGCGQISRWMVWACRLNRKIRITACIHPDRKTAEAFGARYRIPHICTRIEEVVEKAKPDALYIAVPHNVHFTYIKKCIERGLPILCEKPLAIRMQDAEEICRISSDSGVKVGVNYQYRYDRHLYALSQACRQGLLGDIAKVKCITPWHRKQSYFDKGRWRARLESSGGGTLITQGSHILDIALWALGGNIKSVQGTTARKKFRGIEVEDYAEGTVELDNGAVIEVVSSMAEPRSRPVTLDVYGSLGSARYRGFLFPRLSVKGKKWRREKPPVSGLHPFLSSLEGFRRWVRDDEPFLIPASETLPVLEAVLGIYKSAGIGEKVFIK